jgi:hypothetical protein
MSNYILSRAITSGTDRDSISSPFLSSVAPIRPGHHMSAAKRRLLRFARNSCTKGYHNLEAGMVTRVPPDVLAGPRRLICYICSKLKFATSQRIHGILATMEQDREHSHVKLKPNLAFFLSDINLLTKNFCNDCRVLAVKQLDKVT